MKTKLISIIIPAYNERNTIEPIISKILSLNLDSEIIVVDDHSTDGTIEKIEEIRASNPNIKIIRHDKNLGKGAAIKNGFAAAGGDVAIIQDADLEYDPNDIPKVIQPILDGYADVVYGSRFAGHPRRALFYWHSLGNKFLTFLSNVFTNLNLTDMETCYKAFKKIVYKNIKLESKGFAIEPEITCKIARMRQRIYEVPISYRGRSYFEGKKINWKDGLVAIFAIIKHSFFSKISDDVGFRTLELMSAAERYNKFIYKKIKSHIDRRVLEVGSGIGNMTKYLQGRDLVLATDVSESHLHILSNSFENSPVVKTEKLDLNDFNDVDLKKHNFDTIVCLNVLEHIEDDARAIKKLRNVLPKGGKLILLVPACQWAFTGIDANLGHFRRYSKSDITKLANENDFKISALSYFNLPGIIGWFVNGKILRRKALSKGQMVLFNLMLPILMLENVLPSPIGLSLISVLEKK